MKFSVEAALSTGGRLGLITQSNCHGNVAIETPMCTLFTNGGSAPYLSVEMLNRVSRVPQVAATGLSSIAIHHEAVAESGQSLGQFSAMKKSSIFTTLHTAGTDVPSGKNDKLGIAVWGKGGKLKLDTSLFMKIQKSFRPDWFQSLSDGDTDKTCGRKRLTKAVDRTLDFLDEIVDIWQKSTELKHSSLIGVIEGGFCVEERIRSAKETATRPVDGFLIEGFEKGHSGLDLFSEDNFVDLINQTVSHLPEDKPRIMETVWSPTQVLKAFRLGIDIFSSAYPHTLTEKGYALVANYQLPPQSPSAQLEFGAIQPQGMYIDLSHKRYVDDFHPLLEGCACYTCTNFTCAYIHHLLNTSELLAYVLLTIHNFEQYFEFFHCLRSAAKDGRVAELEEVLTRQIHPEIV